MKKASRFAALLAAVMLFGSVAAMPALADEGVTPTPVPTATAEPTVTPAPTDNGQSAPNNSGSAYIIAQTVTDAAGGEITTIDRDSRFNLILRVADYGAYNNFIPADQISARINSSVFTFTGNAEVGQLYEETDANGAGYYSYVLLFRDVIYNGGGNSVPINLSYLNSTMAMQQLSVTLGQCVDEDPDTPNLMIRASSYGNEAVVAGTPFTLTLTLYATGGQEDLNDVVISLTLPDGITMTSGSLSSYLGTMAPKSTRDVSFSLTPSAGFTGGVANITVNSVGTGADTNKAVTGMSTTISVPVSQPDRFELGQLELSDSITLGDSASVTLNFVNKGRDALSNLEATLSGDNLGADTVRLFSMFAAPPEQSLEWNEAGVDGMARFLRRLWAQVQKHAADGAAPALDVAALDANQKALRRKTHETIGKVGDDYGRRHSFNTAIAAVMELMNALAKFEDGSEQGRAVRQEALQAIVLLLNPITPHASHALWQVLGHGETLLEDQPFPQADAGALVRDALTLAVQVNGKLRGTIEVAADAAREQVEALALAEPNAAKFMEGLTVRKIIIVPGKIVNIVAA